jgi:hypothetical protein
MRYSTDVGTDCSIYSGNRNFRASGSRFVSSIFMGIIGALGLVLWELGNAPIGYESEDGFHFGEQISLTPLRQTI